MKASFFPSRLKLLLASTVLLGTSPTRGQIVAAGTITVSTGSQSSVLRFGLASDATNGLDAQLGEAFLPPLPPSGVFDARFIGKDLDTGSNADFRQGDVGFTGMVVHRVRFQRPTGTTDVMVSWVLPDRAQARLRDTGGGILVDESLAPSGSMTITQAFVNELDLEVSYSAVGVFVERPVVLPRLGLHLFPNPAGRSFTVENPSGYGVLSLFDLLGRLVYSTQIQAGRNEINVSEFPSGNYFLLLRDSEGFLTSRIVTLTR
jgi:Secretion system C-terminal sorting domain